ncbi:MAG: hypothetical protein LBU91_05530 [Bacteroidales bacterium]|jgi:hypothetical protein|nr:hypothetical protein [Bacteroidales bacterium]
MRPLDEYVGTIGKNLQSSNERNYTDLANTFSAYANSAGTFVETGGSSHNIVWIPDIAANISFQKVPNGWDAVSFWFSGCAMAKFKHKVDNLSYVCHIYLNGNNKERMAWQKFMKHDNIEDVILFMPFAYVRPNNYEDIRTQHAIGVIDADNNCKAFLIDRTKTTIASIKDHLLQNDEIAKGKETACAATLYKNVSRPPVEEASDMPKETGGSCCLLI